MVIFVFIGGKLNVIYIHYYSLIDYNFETIECITNGFPQFLIETNC